MLTKIAQAASIFGKANVWAVKGPDFIPGVVPSKYKTFVLDVNTTWARDFGPVAGIDRSGKVAVVDTIYKVSKSELLTINYLPI